MHTDVRRAGRYCALVLLLPVVLTACTFQPRRQVKRKVIYYVDRIAVAADTSPAPGAEKLRLNAALLLTDTAQPFVITLYEQRQTTGDAEAGGEHELGLDLAGTLTRIGTADTGHIEAKLVLQSIVLKFGRPDQQEAMFAYDSARDKPGTGNPLADLMTHVAGAELSLRLDSAGRLKDLSGLDLKWRQANIILAPPALETAQWMFRDASMTELVAEALFPPLPDRPVGIHDTWEADVPANIPLAARLDSHLRWRVVRLPGPGDRSPVIEIEATGTVRPAPAIRAGMEPAIQPLVKSSSHRGWLGVAPASHSLMQDSRRTIEVHLTLKPPAGDQQLHRVIKQQRSLSSSLGSRPAPATAP